MVTLNDRPDITINVFSHNSHCWKTSCQCLCTCKSETTSCQQLLFYDFVSAALCSTDDLQESLKHTVILRDMPK